MKTTNNLRMFLLLILLAWLLVGCQGAAPAAPATETGMTQPPANTTPSAPDQGGGSGINSGEDVGSDSGALPAVRPTTAAVAALSQSFPAFDGLYWTGEVTVIPVSERAVRLVSGLPCADLLDLLSAGEWRVAERAIPQPAYAGMFSTLARLERNQQQALVDLKGFVFTELTIGDQAATADPAAVENFPGCSGTVQMLSHQQVSATGEESVEGLAVQFPTNGGCVAMDGETQVKLLYEGPGDFRAWLDFTIPAAPGEYSLEETDLSFSIARSNTSYVQAYADAYARGAFNEQDGEDLEGTEYYPVSDEAGLVRVDSTSPLSGEVILTDVSSDWGGTQTFRAGFSCP